LKHGRAGPRAAELAVLGDCSALPAGWTRDRHHAAFDDGDRFLLSSAPFGFDLYLVLPRQSGVPALDLIRILRRRAPGAAVLALADAWPASLAPWLDAGADMVLPASVQAAELQAAIAALLRRLQPAAGGGPWRLLESDSALVLPDGARLALSEAERTLLACLADAPQHRAERAALLERLWGPAAAPMHNALQALVYRLRRRIDRAWPAGAPLHAVSRVGYEFRAPLRRLP
jgi:two-component system OmpR family response regulator